MLTSITVPATQTPPLPMTTSLNEVFRSGEQITTAERVNQRRRPNTRVNNVVNSGPIFEQFRTIMLRYIDSTKTINTIFSKIESIPDNGHIQWSDIIRSIAHSSRPGTELGRQMMGELNDAGFIVPIISYPNKYNIRKGPIFPS